MNHTVPDAREPAHHSQWDTLRIPVTVHQGAAAVIGWGPKEYRKAFRSYTSWPLWPRPWPTMAPHVPQSPFMATLDHPRSPSCCTKVPHSTPDHPWPSRTALDHPRPPLITLDHPRPPWTTLNYQRQPQPPQTNQNQQSPLQPLLKPAIKKVWEHANSELYPL